MATGSSIPSAASDRFSDYDQVESKLFGLCRGTPLDELAEVWDGNVVPSRAFNDGGIQEAIVNYEDAVFFDVLAEELARRDMGYPQITRENYDDLVGRMEDYLEEFEAHGTDNIVVEAIDASLITLKNSAPPPAGRSLSTKSQKRPMHGLHAPIVFLFKGL